MEDDLLSEATSKLCSIQLLNALHVKSCDGKTGIYFTKHTPQLNGMWDMLVAGTNGDLPMTNELYFNSKVPGIYINILDLTGIRVRASLNEDCVAPWTSGAERMRLDNFFGAPGVGISSKPSPTTRRVILQRYSKHPRGLPISKKILSIPDAEKPHMFAEGTNALVLYFVKSPFEVQAKGSYKRISADSKQVLIDLIEKNPMLSTERIHELMTRELDGQSVPDLKRIQFQQKKYLKSLFVQKKPKRIAGSRSKHFGRRNLYLNRMFLTRGEKRICIRCPNVSYSRNSGRCYEHIWTHYLMRHCDVLEEFLKEEKKRLQQGTPSTEISQRIHPIEERDQLFLANHQSSSLQMDNFASPINPAPISPMAFTNYRHSSKIDVFEDAPDQENDEPSSSSLSHSPLNALLMQTSSLTNRMVQSPQPGTEYESFEEKIPSYYMDLARGVSVKQALSTHRKVPETGQLFTGAQKLVLDGIVKTLNELLLKSDNNGFNGEETPINVLQLFPDIKPTSGNGF
ncbi:unnamed protein product, partial [Mesorhabditis belari]|uniref:Uncharacterized protein n=1 Tax=Mesorhabditis belari TaxID=2138241 RepID=A0AAF3F914_9BILA